MEADQLLRQRLRRAVPPVVGAGVAWSVYPRQVHTPMNTVLDIVAARLGTDATLVWVDDGTPEVLALPGLPQPVVAWSRRSLASGLLIRTLLLADGLTARTRRILCRQAALHLLAETALRLGDTDLAARCGVAAFLDRDWTAPRTGSLETSADSEDRLALWFFALAHEFGHFADPRTHARGPLTDASVRTMLLAARRHDGHDLIGDVLHRRPLRPADVRAETVADLFAADVLVEASARLLPDGGHPVRVIGEVLLAAAVVSAAERCRAFCAMVGRRGDGRLDHLTYPAAASVRSSVLRAHLAAAMTERHGSGRPSPVDRLQRWDRIVAGVATPLEPALAVLETGVTDAFREALDDSVPIEYLMERLRPQAGPALRAEARDFVHLVQASGRHGEWLDELVYVLG
ncbi:hypothetical protein J2S43_000846 [Catenuloplanes nepalensis]|uniref:Uncharacterized protein n=1 Tax=Catenuloplanes nepalensis TaxID=587533 RepID=A0ABT9MLR0_9ACTN|nr:hypothetical protein [Catenuloplanes nepalensis]MDP9792334.1 hypothetical protein [Catenuloplanes nepalensis]